METLNAILGFANNLTDGLFTFLLRPVWGRRSKTRVDAIITLPNLMSTIRVFIGIALWRVAGKNGHTALTLFLVGLLTDRLDGTLARITGVTKSGEIIDPTCDKVFFFFCVLAYAKFFSLWVVLSFLGIELLILVAPPVILKAKQLKMSAVDLRATNHGKGKFGLECAAIGTAMLGYSPRIGDMLLAAAIPLAILSITDKLKAVLGTAEK